MTKWITALLILALSPLAYGQDSADPAAPARHVPRAFLFQAGSWDVNIIAGAYEESFGGNDEIIAFAGLDIEYFILDGLALFAEPLGYYIEQGDPDAAAIGLNLGARWYFWQPTDTFAVYAEGGLGIIEAEHRVPSPHGTHHNFVEQLGIGAKLRLGNNFALMGGVRYQHLSNASIHGSERNPGLDAFGGYGGLSIAF